MNYIGHASTKRQLEIAAVAAAKKNEALPHMLFTGAAGCGKTSLARFVAQNCDVDFMPLSASSVVDHKTTLDVMEKLNHENYDRKGNRLGKIKPPIIFIDEVHQLKLLGQESLGVAMENFRLPAGSKNTEFWFPYFTVIAATTDDGKLSKPFRDRFKMTFVFEPYSEDEISEIIKMHFKNKYISIITDGAVKAIAVRSRGVPRIAVRYLDRIKDYSYANSLIMVTKEVAEAVFKELGIDKEGITKVELKILKYLYDAKIPVGLDNLAIVVNEAPKTLKDSAEPFLMQRGLIIRSSKGRVLTPKGVEYLERSGYAGNKSAKIQIPAGYKRV